MLKNFKVFNLLLVILLCTSSIGYAGSYNNQDIDCNQTYAQNCGYKINYNNDYYYSKYFYNYVARNTAPVKPEIPKEVPSAPSQPNIPTQPTTPVEPAKPVEPVQNYSGMSADEIEVVRLVNVEREKAGLTPLKASSELSKVARAKSEDMARNNYFSHTSPTYGSPFDMMKQFGISYKTAGENIAKGYLSSASVMNGWMNSSGHRDNILNSSFGTIGVGAYKQGSTIYWTQMFTN